MPRKQSKSPGIIIPGAFASGYLMQHGLPNQVHGPAIPLLSQIQSLVSFESGCLRIPGAGTT